MENEKKKFTLAYKGMDSNYTCRNIQFVVGKKYSLPDGLMPSICERGFHAVNPQNDPLNVFCYYNPAYGGQPSHYCLVGLSGLIQKSATKICSEHITILNELDIMGLFEAHKVWIIKNLLNQNEALFGNKYFGAKGEGVSVGNKRKVTCDDEGSAIAGSAGYAHVLNFGTAASGSHGISIAGLYGTAIAGDSGAAFVEHSGAAVAGAYGLAIAREHAAAVVGDTGIAKAGDYGSALAGNNSCAYSGHSGTALSGDGGHSEVGEFGAAVAGCDGMAIVGNFGAAVVGSCGKAIAGDTAVAVAGMEGSAIAGVFGVAVAAEFGLAVVGNYGAACSLGSVAVGAYGVGIARCKKPHGKGSLGALIFLAVEIDDKHSLDKVYNFIIDGYYFKEDIWYTVEDGQILEDINFAPQK